MAHSSSVVFSSRCVIFSFRVHGFTFRGRRVRWVTVQVIVRQMDRTSIAVRKRYGSTVKGKVLVLINVRRTSKRRSVS